MPNVGHGPVLQGQCQAPPASPVALGHQTTVFPVLTHHGIIEFFRVEKFRITKSHHQPDLPSPITNPRPSVPRPRLLNTSRDGDSSTSLSARSDAQPPSA